MSHRTLPALPADPDALLVGRDGGRSTRAGRRGGDSVGVGQLVRIDSGESQPVHVTQYVDLRPSLRPEGSGPLERVEENTLQ